MGLSLLCLFSRLRLFLRLFLVLVLAGFSGCKKEPAQTGRPPVLVSVVKIEEKDLPATFEYVGVVSSSHEVEIRARVTGYLEEIGYIEGSAVKKDDLLFQLDPRPFQASVAQEKAQVANEEAVLWQATRAVERFRPLYEEKAASQRDLDNATAAEMSAKAQVLGAKAILEKAEIDLSYTTIRSPVSGLASQAKYRVGSLISPSQNLLTTISVLDPIWVMFSVSEQDMLLAYRQKSKGRLVYPSDEQFTVEIILADGSVFPEKGIINFASPTYSEKTGTMMIRSVLKNPDNLLRPGQFVRARVLGAIRPHAIAVPQKAVVQSKSGTFVFVVNDKNTVEARPIEPGPWDGQNWIIYGGLKNGDLVVVDGVNKIVPGAHVKIVPPGKTDELGNPAS